MRLNIETLKCFGFCVAFCSALCLAQLFLAGCSTQETSKKKESSPNMQTITDNKTPFACNMADLNSEEKKRTLDLLKELKTKSQEVKEMPDGYAFRFAMDSETFRNAAEFVTYERRCCPFFEFELNVEKDNGAMWLQLKGNEGVKDFIKIEFDV